MVRFLAAAYIAHGPQPIPSSQLRKELELDDPQMARVGQILFRASNVWSTWLPTEGSFQLIPRDDVVYLEDVSSLDELFERLNRIQSEAVEAGRLQWDVNRIAAGPVEPEDGLLLGRVPSVLAIRHGALRAVAEHDLSQLSAAITARAWKAAAIFAGCCLEALLLDLWFRHEQRARETWVADWPDRVTLSQMVDRAAEFGLINVIHKDLSSAIRRARNLVHPLRAASEPLVTRELVGVLLATISLLDRELRAADAG